MMTFDKSGRSFTGCRPDSFAVTAERLGAVRAGNQLFPGTGRDLPDRRENREKHKPAPHRQTKRRSAQQRHGRPTISVRRNLPGRWRLTPHSASRSSAAACGTSPEYIRELRKTFLQLKPSAVPRDSVPRVCSSLQLEVLESVPDDRLREAPRSPEQLIEDALEQSDGGSAIVTVLLPGSLTPEQAGHVIRGIQTQSDRPLVLLSDDLNVLEGALREIPGSPAVRCTGCAKGRSCQTRLQIWGTGHLMNIPHSPAGGGGMLQK